MQASSTVYAITSSAVIRYDVPEKDSHLQVVRFSCFPSFLGKRRKNGVSGRWRPSAGSEVESLRRRKRRRSGGSMPPGGERSVCGMSGRKNAAAPSIFVEHMGIPHSDSPAPRMVVFRLAQADPHKPSTTANKISRGRRSAREGCGAAKSPRAPTASATSTCGGKNLAKTRAL